VIMTAASFGRGLKPILAVLLGAASITALVADSKPNPLFDAMRQGDMAAVKAAVNSGTDVNIRDQYGNTLVMHAAVYGTAADLDFLLAHEADVNAANQAGHTALMRAMPDLPKIKLLVEHKADVNAATADGTTPVMLAARISGAEAVLRYLISRGADIGRKDRRGSDALMIAATAGAAGNLRILLDAGASGSRRRENVLAPRQFPDSVSRPVVDRALRFLDGSTALMGAATADCEACVRLLLEHGAEAKAKTASGYTALHSASYEGNSAIVKQLLDAGSPVSAADERGLTPLMMAANSRTKDPEVVRMLLNRGADPEAKDSSGRTAAEWARIGARRDVVRLLPTTPPAEELPASATEPASSRDIHAAVAKSITLLGETAPQFFRKTGCISCHNVSIPMMALTEARRRGYSVNPASMQQMVKETIASLGPHRENLLSGYCSIPGMPTTSSYAAISMHGEGYRADAFTDGMVRCLAVDQRADGDWAEGGTRPPLSPDSRIPGTALSARTLRLYPVPAIARQLDSAVDRARAYLLSARPWFGDDYAYRLLGLFWTDASRPAVDAAALELIAQQQPDGGWAQTPDMPSDAYATGLALSALAMAAPAQIASDAYHRGVEYLMRTQRADGSWHVRSRAFGFQPYFESGFPHGPDQWISMSATAWAATALMPAAERQSVGAR
jgi:ankyrin repeat protein